MKKRDSTCLAIILFFGISTTKSQTITCCKILLHSLHLLYESTYICYLNNLRCHVNSTLFVIKFSHSKRKSVVVKWFYTIILSELRALHAIRMTSMERNLEHWIMWGTVTLAYQSGFQLANLREWDIYIIIHFS